MMQRPWDCAQPDEWLPQSLRLCWGGDGGSSGDGGSGFSGDSGGWGGDSGGWGGDSGGWGATTGGGDWGSAGSADFSGSWAGGDVNAWAGTAYDASTAGTGAGMGGDWGSFSSASFPDSTPGAIFTDVAGPNPGVTTGGGDWGSAGTSSFAGTGGGPGGTFSAESGVGSYGGSGGNTGGGLFGDYGTGGGFTGGGLYGGGQVGASFGGFGSAGTSSGGRSGGPLGGSNMVSAAPSGGRAFADTVGGGTLSGQTSGRTSDAPTRGEAEVASAGDVDSGRADADADADPAQSDFGKPATSEAVQEADPGPSLSDAAPAGNIGGNYSVVGNAVQTTAAPAQTETSSQTSAFGPQSVNAEYQGSPYASDYDQAAPSQAPASFDSRFGDWGQQDATPSQAYQQAAQTLSDLTQSALSGYDYQGSPYADMGQQPTAPDFNQAFQAFEAQPGWNPAEQTAGRAGLAEPTDWAGNPFAPSTDVSVGRDFDQVFADVANQPTDYEGSPYADMGPQFAPDFNQAFQAFDTPTGVDLAGDFATGRTTDLANQLGLNNLTVGPGLPTSPVFGVTGLNYAPLVHDTQQPANVELVPADQAPPPPELAPPPPPPEAAPVAPTDAAPTAPPPEAAPVAPSETAPTAPPEAAPTAPPEAAPVAPPQTSQVPPSLIEQLPQAPPPQQTPPSLIEQVPTPPSQTPPAQPPTAPPQQPPPQPGEPGEPDHDEEGEPLTDAPPQPGRPLGAPTTRTQNTPINTARVRQEQQAGIRNRPVSEALHGVLTRAAEQAGVVVRVGSGGQVATRARADHKQHGGWTGSIRHNHGNAADVRLEQNGRLLSFNNPNDLPIMEAFVREAARLGATGMGAGIRYMGDKTIHVGFGDANFWNADNPGSRGLRQAWSEGRQGPANRPPADIPVRTAQPGRRPAGPPLPGRPGVGGDAARDARLVAPPAPLPEVPVALPPQQPAPAPAPIDRPPADIPAPIVPAPFLTPPARGRADPKWQAERANAILKQATAHLNKQSGEADFQAASKVAAKELAAAGIPLATARSLMTKGAYEGAEAVGYGPSSMGWNAIYKGRIDGGIEAALQGYNPAATGPTPQGGRYGPGPVQGPQGFQPDAPAAPGRQGSLLDFLQNFNPISTAEARSGRSQAGNLQAPRADPGTIQSRLSSQRSNVIDDLQTNQGLRNTLDLIVTGEVGSQGKAAVLGFLETAMNKVAAEASRQGREATGRDLLNYLNNRSYFPDTWGKIESGKIKGGALTDDLLDAVAGGSNTTKGSTGNSSAKSAGSRFGGNPTNTTIGREHYGVENYAHHAAWYNALGALDTPAAVGSMPPMPAPAPAELRGLAKGGRVDKDEPVVVGEEGPEFFVPDRPGTVVPHMPQARREPSKNIDRWPKMPAPDYPGRYGGVEREILRQTRAAQNPAPGLMDLIDSGRLPLNEANWRAMLNDPSLIALGRSRMDDRREGIDPGAEQYGAFIPAPGPAAEPPDPGSPMAQALGYGSIKRRPMRIGRQDYSQ